MKNYEMLLKLRADVGEIRKATDEINRFKTQIQSVGEQIKTGVFLAMGGNLGNSLTGVISNATTAYLKQEAAEMKLASAMDAVGKFAKSNTEDFKKMSAEVKRLTVIGDEQVLQMQTMAQRMGVSSDRMQECVGGAIKLQRTYGMGLAESIKASAEAMDAVGVSAAANVEDFKKMASEIQQLTVIGDEQVLSMQAMALNMGVSKERMQECIEGAIGLQRAFGLGLNESIRAAAAVVQGKTEKLNELIPSLATCATKEEKLAKAQQAMRNGFEQARAETETLQGALTQLSNAWGDVSEIVGESVAPVVRAAAVLLKELAEILVNNRAFVVSLTRALVAMVAVLALKKLAGFLSLMKNITVATKASTTATIAETAAIGANTTAKAANAAATAAQQAAIGSAAAKTVASMGAIRAAMAAVITTGGALAAAISACVWAYSRWCDATADVRKAEEEFSNSVNKGSQERLSQIEAEISVLQQKGGTLREIKRLQDSIDENLDFATRERRSLEQAGLDTSKIDAHIRKYRELKEVMGDVDVQSGILSAYKLRERGTREDIGKIESDAAAKSAEINDSRDATEKFSDAERALAEQKAIVKNLRKRIDRVHGDDLEVLRDELKVQLEKQLVLERQFVSAKRQFDIEENQKQSAAARLNQMQRKLEYEIALNDAITSGDKLEAERLRKAEKIRDIVQQLVEAGANENDATDIATRKVEAEMNAELARAGAEEQKREDEKAARLENERVKKRESFEEELGWERQLADARLSGDEKRVELVRQQREICAEAKRLAQEQGISFDEALKKATELFTLKNLGTDGGGAQGAARRPRAPKKPRAAATGKTDSSGLFNLSTGLRNNGLSMAQSGGGSRGLVMPPPRGIRRAENPASMLGSVSPNNEAQMRIAESMKETNKTLAAIKRSGAKTATNTQAVPDKSLKSGGANYRYNYYEA